MIVEDDLLDDTLRMRRVVNHAVRVHEIEGVVFERQRLGVVVDEAARQSTQSEILPGVLEVALR